MEKRTKSFHAPGPWAQLVAVTAICPDGKIRKIRLRPAPDTYFSVQGRTSILGIPVKGLVMTVGAVLCVKVGDPSIPRNVDQTRAIGGVVLIDNPDEGEYIFTPSPSAKNFEKLQAKLAELDTRCDFCKENAISHCRHEGM